MHTKYLLDGTHKVIPNGVKRDLSAQSLHLASHNILTTPPMLQLAISRHVTCVHLLVTFDISNFSYVLIYVRLEDSNSNKTQLYVTLEDSILRNLIVLKGYKGITH